MEKIRKSLVRLSAYVLFSIVLVAVAGVIYQTVGTVADQRAFSPPGRLVDVGEGRLHINCSGEGSPTVVLDAGGAGSSLTWYLVQSDLAHRTHVCSFDRMGFGWSESFSRPHTTSEYVALQDTLLQNAGVDGPYLLVGHSLGGLNAQLFASQHPEKVAGMVLVDSAHEDLFELLPEFEGVDRPFLRAMRIASRLGVVRLVLNLGFLDPLPQSADLPQELRAMSRAELSRPKHWDSTYNMNTLLAESAAQVRTASPLPEMPMIVIAHGTGDMFAGLDPRAAERAEYIWRELQSDLAQRVPGGRLVVAESSGHMIPLEQPDRVIEAVHQVLDYLHQSNQP